MTNPEWLALYLEDLDALRQTREGDERGDEHLVFGPKCHPQSGLKAGYRDGIVALVCMSCGKDVVRVHVAGRGTVH